MSENELKAVFAYFDSFGFYGKEEASATLSKPRNLKNDFQWGPQWMIFFQFKKGVLSDYSISMPRGK
jgi:hypothetical protein